MYGVFRKRAGHQDRNLHLPGQRPGIVPGKDGNQFRDTGGMSCFTEISKGSGVPGSEYLTHIGDK